MDGTRDKPSGITGSPTNKWVDTHAPGDSFTEQFDQQGHVEEITHGDGPVFTNVIQTPSGLEIHLEGRPPQNETGVEAVCRRLALAIEAATGVPTSGLRGRPVGAERGTDWNLAHGVGTVPVQVTRVGREETWSTLHRAGEVTFDRAVADMAAEVARAIKSKRNKIDAGTILALDAGVSGGAMFQRVVDAWRTTHSHELKGMLVREIWLVGYSAHTTFRLH